MDSDYTHISIILDRTGSMESIRDDTIGGFNAFLKEQKSQPGKATLTLVQFDTQDPYEVVHHFKPIQDIPEITHETYVPRASTPLLDAIGRGINDIEQSLLKIKDGDNPSKIIFVIITDGRENSSKEFHKEQVLKMVQEKTENENWQFVFLGADLDSINDAISFGINKEAALLFDKSGEGILDGWTSLSENITGYRSKRKKKIGFVPDE